jgi:hypothetical protein
MLGRLFKWVVVAALFCAVVWNFRDTEAVRQRRPLIEGAMSLVGMSEASVRRYWPVEGAASGSAPLATVSYTREPSTPEPGSSPSLWNDLVKRYNPITLLSDRIYSKDQVTRQNDEAQKRSTSP